MEQITLKALKGLDLKQQLLFVESYLPDAWEYLHDANGVQLPTFDDNDEIVPWGVSCGVTPQDENKKEDTQ